MKMNLERITFDPQVMGGKPCIRGLRVTVGTVVGLVATGYSTEDILTLKKKIFMPPWPMQLNCQKVSVKLL